MATSSYIVKMHWRSIKTVFGYLAYMMIYVNNCTHAGQDGIFRGENVMLVIPDGKYIRREENLSVTLVIYNPRDNLDNSNIINHCIGLLNIFVVNTDKNKTCLNHTLPQWEKKQ